MSGEQRQLDGNGVAALLEELLGADATGLVRVCAGCGQRHALGAHRAYRGAGWVLRCPGCADVAVVIGVAEERLTLQTRGTFAIPR